MCRGRHGPARLQVAAAAVSAHREQAARGVEAQHIRGHLRVRALHGISNSTAAIKINSS